MRLLPVCLLACLLATSSLAGEPSSNQPRLLSNDGADTLVTMNLPWYDTPSGIGVTSDAGAVYVVGRDLGIVYAFDTVGNCILNFQAEELVGGAGMAITSDDSLVYVCSPATNAVKVFDAVGNFVFSFGADVLVSPLDVAIASDDTTVYVASRGSGDIQVFEAGGGLLFSFTRPDGILDPTGLALTSDDELLYVANHDANAIEVFTATGEYIDTLVTGIVQPSDVALSSDDSLVYAISTGSATVEVFDNTGNSLLGFGENGLANSDSELALTLDDAVLAITNFTLEPEPGPCEGDANGSGEVDPLDVGFVLSQFGCITETGDCNCLAADQNGDGVVDPLDSGFVLARFGDCP